MSLKNIIHTGASGDLGKVVLDRLVASNKFNITILRRSPSSSTFAHNLPVIDADFNSLESLTAALKGQDAVIVTTGPAGTAGQTLLIDAAIAAGVKRFIPSEFGSDISQPTSRSLPVFAEKVKIADYIEEKAEQGKITYTAIYNNVFLDWGLDHNLIFDHEEYAPALIDGGDYVWSSTLLADVGDAVVGVLTHPKETANREVRIESAKLSQNKILQIAKEIAPEKPWAPKEVPLKDLLARSGERLAKGLYDMETFVPYLYMACFHPDGKPSWEKNDNELLGLKMLSDEQVKEVVRKHLK